jgi:hypothetical protein
LFVANDISRGGSFYLQSKIFRSRQALEEELRRRPPPNPFMNNANANANANAGGGAGGGNGGGSS